MQRPWADFRESTVIALPAVEHCLVLFCRFVFLLASDAESSSMPARTYQVVSCDISVSACNLAAIMMYRLAFYVHTSN